MNELELLEQQLISRIDDEDLLEVKKVKRYIELLKLDQECNVLLKEEGITTVTENGKQRFVKSHPLLNEKAKINSQLIALEKTFNFVMDPLPATAPSSTVEDHVGNKDGYSADDLV